MSEVSQTANSNIAKKNSNTPAVLLQAMNELHEDEDFQADASQARMLGIVDEVRGNLAALARYNDDAAVMHVLSKLRRFQVGLGLILLGRGMVRIPEVP
jgi:hypothetical protein